MGLGAQGVEGLRAARGAGETGLQDMGKTGILGGTFDPIHRAHLVMGRRAMEEEGLDRVLFMPSKIPPHKMGRSISPESVRRDMVELAVADEAGFYFSDFEFRRQEITYTARTLSLFQEEQPEEELYFILGGDSLFYFEKWYRPEEILRHATLLAFSRDGLSGRQMEERANILMGRFGGEIRVISMPWMEMSSSGIRERIARGESVEEYLPHSVYRYILETGCYHGKRIRES